MRETLHDLTPDFLRTTSRIVWCVVATIDEQGRPRSRILHPIWEEYDGALTGWVLTGKTPIKTAHLARNQYVSCTYWDPEQDTAIAECRATWVDDLETRRHIFNLFHTTQPPLGYDLSGYGAEAAESPIFTPLRFDPWRIQVMTL